MAIFKFYILRRAAYILNEFRSFGFDSALQHFNTSDGIGVNTFAVYKAPRSDGKEALVLSAPWQSRTGDCKWLYFPYQKSSIHRD